MIIPANVPHYSRKCPGWQDAGIPIFEKKEKSMQNDKKYAILIDAENVAAKYIKLILDEISNEGVATYKRIYGDWTKGQTSAWKETLLENSVTPMQQYSYTTGKNSSDSAMIIDAMDILYSGKVDGFCIVTSDSDFTRLAARLREAGMDVIGMGEQKTPRPFVAACNQFKYLDKIYAENSKRRAAEKKPKKEPKAVATPAPSEDSQTDLDTIRDTIIDFVDKNSDEDGWLMASEVGDVLAKRYPDFDVRNYGCKKLTAFLEMLDMFEIRMLTSPGNTKNPNGKNVYIRFK